MRLAVFFFVLFSAVSSVRAESAGHQPVNCTAEGVGGASSFAVLHDMATLCDDADLRFSALTKLWKLPLPTPPQIRLAGEPRSGASERVVYELDLFFYLFEDYPPPEALAKLNVIFGKLNACHRIESLDLVVGADRSEQEMGMGRSLVNLRATRIKQYFVSAGLPSTAEVRAKSRTAPMEDHPEVQARARSVTVTVACWRPSP